MTQRRYAAGTEVTVERSRQELERLVLRFEAQDFGYRQHSQGITILFSLNDRAIRLDLKYPDVSDFTWTRDHRMRTQRQKEQAWEQDVRERWRNLVLVVKAKLTAAEAGITTIEEEFLASTVIPNSDETVVEWIGRQMPALKAPQKALGPGAK